VAEPTNYSQYSYKAGALLSLRHHGSDESEMHILVKILKPQNKWTLSCGMVMEILGNATTEDSDRQVEGDSDDNGNSSNGGGNDNGAPQLEIAFLKLYD
jgi:hypothetical protein